MKRLVAGAFAYSDGEIRKIWQAFPPDGSVEDAKKECVRLSVEGMLPLVASPNVRVLTPNGTIPLSDIRQGDDVILT